ncbi:MAG: type II toxin-antitoxin system prevent-host-death family antitoxin [Bacillota bacterium]
MEEIGVRNIKNFLSKYLSRVKRGETLIITERGTPVAKLVPFQPALPKEITDLLVAGLASWKGGKPAGLPHPPRVKGGRTIAGMVAEDRR